MKKRFWPRLSGTIEEEWQGFICRCSALRLSFKAQEAAGMPVPFERPAGQFPNVDDPK